MGAPDRKEDGTRVLTPSRLEDLQHRYRLNPAEAEELFNRREAGEDEETTAQAIKDARVVYRVHTEATYSPASDPREIPHMRREESDEAAARAAEKAEPEAGPYGRQTPYTRGGVTRKADIL
jgi:hypothetical protein